MSHLLTQLEASQLWAQVSSLDFEQIASGMARMARNNFDSSQPISSPCLPIQTLRPSTTAV